jgi:hypothetical protein
MFFVRVEIVCLINLIYSTEALLAEIRQNIADNREMRLANLLKELH